jgi:hypothetical protein
MSSPPTGPDLQGFTYSGGDKQPDSDNDFSPRDANLHHQHPSRNPKNTPRDLYSILTLNRKLKSPRNQNATSQPSSPHANRGNDPDPHSVNNHKRRNHAPRHRPKRDTPMAAHKNRHVILRTRDIPPTKPRHDERDHHGPKDVRLSTGLVAPAREAN